MTAYAGWATDRKPLLPNGGLVARWGSGMNLLELLNIGFWILVLAVGPAVLIRLILALIGKRIDEGVTCAHCQYNRHGQAADASCPECGAKGRPANIRYGRVARSRRRIALRLTALFLVGLLAFGIDSGHNYLTHTIVRFYDALDTKDHQAIQRMVAIHPELAHGIDPYDAMSAWEMPLIIATRNRDHQAMHILIDAGARPINNLAPREYASRPLAIAIYRQDATAVEILLDAGADPNLTHKSGLDSNPLLDAIKSGNLQIVQMLLKHGANPNQPGLWSTPMQRAQYAADADAVKLTRLLLEYEADPDATGSIDEAPALYLAISHEHSQVVRALIDAGVDLDRVYYPEGRPAYTALDRAVRQNQLQRNPKLEEIIRVLRNAGAHSTDSLAP